MPSNKFFLDDQKTQQIEVRWRGFWKDITVNYNGNPMGGFQNLSHLKQGETFTLHDGSPLRIYYSSSYGEQGIRIEHNGRPLKGSIGDPATRLKSILGLAIFIGGLNIVLGAVAEFGDVEFLKQMGIGWVLIVIGAVIIGLGYCVNRYRSVPALIAIIAILAIDIVATVAVAASEGGRPGTGGIVLKVFIIIAMVRGFRAIREVKEAEVFGNERSPFL
jgi:hypothetical protein